MQKRYVDDFLTHKAKENKGELPQYLIEDHHPAIIPRDIWNSVQMEIQRRYDYTIQEPIKRQGYSSVSAMSNRLYCGKCGQPLIRYTAELSNNRIKNKIHVFRCRSNYSKYKKSSGCISCRSKRWSETKLEDAFLNFLSSLQSNDDLRDQISDKELRAKIMALKNEVAQFDTVLFREVIEKVIILDDGNFTWKLVDGTELKFIPDQ